MYTARGTVDKAHVLEEYLPTVTRIARQLKGRLPPNVELDDLVQAGRMGLVEAWSRFQHDASATFDTFARQRIKGAMLDELRAMDWLPRRVRQAAKEVETAIQASAHRLGRAPTEAEIAEQLGLGLTAYRELLLEVQGCQLVYAEDLRDAESDTCAMEALPAADADPIGAMLTGELREHAIRAIAQLPQREAQVLSLHYDDELSMREIGAVLGVNASRASQLHNQAIARLRAMLKELI